MNKPIAQTVCTLNRMECALLLEYVDLDKDIQLTVETLQKQPDGGVLSVEDYRFDMLIGALAYSCNHCEESPLRDRLNTLCDYLEYEDQRSMEHDP